LTAWSRTIPEARGAGALVAVRSTHGNRNLTGAQWRKSSYSNGNDGDCVEVADLPGGMAVRDSKLDARSPARRVNARQWARAASRNRAGELD
jgi:hypothetical protein